MKPTSRTPAESNSKNVKQPQSTGLGQGFELVGQSNSRHRQLVVTIQSSGNDRKSSGMLQRQFPQVSERSSITNAQQVTPADQNSGMKRHSSMLNQYMSKQITTGQAQNGKLSQTTEGQANPHTTQAMYNTGDKSQVAMNSQVDNGSTSVVQGNNSRGHHVHQLFRQAATPHSGNQDYYKGSAVQHQQANLQEQQDISEHLQKMINQSTLAVVQFHITEQPEMMQQQKKFSKTAQSSLTSSAVQNQEEDVEESKMTLTRAVQLTTHKSKKQTQVNSLQSLSGGGLSMLQMHEQALLQNRQNQHSYMTPLADQVSHNQKLLPESMTTSKEYGIVSPRTSITGPITEEEKTSQSNQEITCLISNRQDAQALGVGKRKIFNKIQMISTQLQNLTNQTGNSTRESHQPQDPQIKLKRSSSQDLYLAKQSSLPQPPILPESIVNPVNQKLKEISKVNKNQAQHALNQLRNESRKSEHRHNENMQGSNSAKPLNVSMLIVNGRSPYQQINNSQAYEQNNSEAANTSTKPGARAQLNNLNSIENQRNRIYDVVNQNGTGSMGFAGPQSGVASQHGLFQINEQIDSPQTPQPLVFTNDLNETNGAKYFSTSTTRQGNRVTGNTVHARNDDNLHIAKTQVQIMQNSSLTNSQAGAITARPNANGQSNVAYQARSLYQTHQGSKYNFITPMILSDLHQISQNPIEISRHEPAERENQHKLAVSELPLKRKNSQHLQKNFNNDNTVPSRRSNANGTKLPIKSSAVSQNMGPPSKVKISQNNWQTGLISGSETMPNQQSQGVHAMIAQREESKIQSSIDGRVKPSYFNKNGQAMPQFQRNIMNEMNGRSNGIMKDRNLPPFIQKRRRLKPPTTLHDTNRANSSSADEHIDITTTPSYQFQPEETKQKNPAKFIKQKPNQSQLQQQQPMQANKKNFENPGSIYQTMQENLFKSVAMHRDTQSFINVAEQQHQFNDQIRRRSNTHVGNADLMPKTTSQDGEKEIPIEPTVNSTNFSLDMKFTNEYQRRKREDDVEEHNAEYSEKNLHVRRTPNKKGQKVRHSKADRTSSCKKRISEVQNQFTMEKSRLGVRNNAANRTFQNSEVGEEKQSEENSQLENDTDDDFDVSKESQPQKRQRLSQSSASIKLGFTSNQEESTEINDRAWSMVSIASSCSFAPIKANEISNMQETVSNPQNKEVVQQTKTPADCKEEEIEGKEKLDKPIENINSAEAPYLNQILLTAYNQQVGNENPQQDPVQFGRMKVECFLASNPLNQRFITKEKARLPYSVFKPHANQVTFLKSIFEGRPPVAFFQYPSYVGIKRVADRIRMYTKEEVEHLYMSFRISDSAHIYNAVVNSCKSAGFTMIDSSNTNLFNLQWSGYINANDIKHLNKYQKVNHFPGSTQLGRKDLLWRNMSRMRSKYPKDFAISPISYLIHEEYDAFLAERERDKKALWILKPVASSCGRGIKIINSTQEILKKEGLIASKYIANPHLINGLKYDMRVYVLVTSFNPLRIYMYNDGLVRFATEKYSNDPRKLQKKYVHLTNFSINKKNTNFVKNTDKLGMQNLLKNNKNGVDSLDDEDQQEFDQNTSKWDFKMLQAAYEKHNINYEYVIAQFKDLVVKTLLCVEPHVTQQLQKNPTSRNNCFELYGFDIIVDDNYKPWILEVNVLPSLSSSSPFDKRIKTMLICDTLTLVGIRGYDKQKFHSQTTELLGLAPFAQSMTMSELRQKPRLTGSEKLTRDELEILMDLDEEFMRRGNYQRIFPLASNASFYEQFFETKRYQNALCASYLTSPQHIRDQLLAKHRRIYTSLV